MTLRPGIHSWPQIADSLCVPGPDETVAEALDRVDNIPLAELADLGQRSREGALALQEATVDQWMHVLRAHARNDGECKP